MPSNNRLVLKNLSLVFPHKICFEGFDATIAPNAKIAIIGDNGTGKTTLLKALHGLATPIEGDITLPPNCITAYVPQVVENYETLSGSQRFHKALTTALAKQPDILLLDEPTNHLDITNRRELMNMISRYKNTLIITSHDPQLLRHINTIWDIHNGKISVFSGSYDDYKAQAILTRQSLEDKLNNLEKQKKQAHKDLMQEQERAAGSRRQGELAKARGKWAPIVAGGKKRQAQKTAGAKTGAINNNKAQINRQIMQLGLREIIKPSFILPAGAAKNNVLFIADGTAGYEGKTILRDINISIDGAERIALIGDNAGGKSTLIKAINNPALRSGGIWQTPRQSDLGYLDQHYSNITDGANVLAVISALAPSMTHAQIRKHLNDFLFRKNEEVTAPLATLSGGERARLSLAAIACKVPQILMLDEITNNIDLQTRQHIEQILINYPAALLVISHDVDFLKNIGVQRVLEVKDGTVKKGTLP